MEELLDSLNDNQLYPVLWQFFGQYEPIWEECTEEEYEKGQSKQFKRVDSSLCGHPEEQLHSLEELEEWFLDKQFKKVPIYKEWKGGILDLIKLQDTKKPDYYKYYKLVGYKKLILVGGKLADYLKKRGIKFD